MTQKPDDYTIPTLPFPGNPINTVPGADNRCTHDGCDECGPSKKPAFKLRMRSAQDTWLDERSTPGNFLYWGCWDINVDISFNDGLNWALLISNSQRNFSNSKSGTLLTNSSSIEHPTLGLVTGYFTQPVASLPTIPGESYLNKIVGEATAIITIENHESLNGNQDLEMIYHDAWWYLLNGKPGYVELQ